MVSSAAMHLRRRRVVHRLLAMSSLRRWRTTGAACPPSRFHLPGRSSVVRRATARSVRQLVLASDLEIFGRLCMVAVLWIAWMRDIFRRVQWSIFEAALRGFSANLAGQSFETVAEPRRGSGSGESAARGESKSNEKDVEPHSESKNGTVMSQEAGERDRCG